MAGVAGGVDAGPSCVAALESLLRPLGLFRTRAARLVDFARMVLGVPPLQRVAVASHGESTGSSDGGSDDGSSGSSSDVDDVEEGEEGDDALAGDGSRRRGTAKRRRVAADATGKAASDAASPGRGIRRASVRPTAAAPATWWCPCQLPGMGTYAVEAFWLLFTERWAEITPADHALQWYRQWRDDFEGPAGDGEVAGAASVGT